MPRLPQPGSDDGQWGEILNDFLLQSHDASGDLKPGVVMVDHMAPGVVDDKVSGPGSSVLNTVPRFADDTGRVLKGSSVQIKDDGKIANVTNPTDAQDVATKNYTDAQNAVKASGPASATVNAIPRYSDATGKNLKDSMVTLSDAGALEFNWSGMSTQITNNNLSFNRPGPSYVSQNGSNGSLIFTTKNSDNTTLARMTINSGEVGRVTISNANLYIDSNSNAGGTTRLQVEGNTVVNGQQTNALTTTSNSTFGLRTTLLTGPAGLTNLMAMSSVLRTLNTTGTTSGTAHLAQVQFDATSPTSGGDLMGLQARLYTNNNTGTGPINRFAALNASTPTSGQAGAAYSLATSHGLRVDNQGVWGGVASSSTVATAVGIYITAQTGAATANYGIYFDGATTGVGSGISWAGDTSLYRSAASTLHTPNHFTANQITTSNTLTAQSVNVSGGSMSIFGGGSINTASGGMYVATANGYGRIALTPTGSVEFGDGTNARDTSLYRKAANQLATDNTLFMANQIAEPATPTAGGVLFIQAGALKYKGSGGTVTTLGPA